MSSRVEENVTDQVYDTNEILMVDNFVIKLHYDNWNYLGSVLDVLYWKYHKLLDCVFSTLHFNKRLCKVFHLFVSHYWRIIKWWWRNLLLGRRIPCWSILYHPILTISIFFVSISLKIRINPPSIINILQAQCLLI